MNWTNPAISQLFNTSVDKPSNGSNPDTIPVPAHRLRPGIIAAIVVASVIGASLLGILIFSVIRRHNAQLMSKAQASNGNADRPTRYHEKAGPEFVSEIGTSTIGTWSDRAELGPEMVAPELSMNRFSQPVGSGPELSSRVEPIQRGKSV